MASYSGFHGESGAFQRELLGERLKASLAKSRVSPPSSSSAGFYSGSSVDTPCFSSHSLFTPPQVDLSDNLSNVSALQTLVQMAMNKSISPPPFAVPPQLQSNDYSSAAASLLSCLSAPPKKASEEWSPRQLKRQVSSESASSAIQALLNSGQLNVSTVQGRVMELATDRNGSRLLQKLLTQGGVEVISRVIDEVENHLTVIMCDTYANYMCQQLFQAANASQRLRLLSRLSPRFVEVARDRRGTHSLQALISHISTPEEEDLLANTIQGQTESIALDVHATHVLQQAISCCLPKQHSSSGLRRLDFVFEEVARCIERLAVDPNALGVVKRCITHSHVRGFAPVLAERIETFMFVFVENPYANYAVQHALEVWAGHPHTAHLAERLVSRLTDKIAPMALHKFASNVAEMAIKSSKPHIRYALIDSLHYSDDSRMLSLMRSPFGVFVVGTAIKHAEDPVQANSLTLAICRNLKKLPEGRNKSKWEKLLGECAYSHPLLATISLPLTPSTASDTASIISSQSRC